MGASQSHEVSSSTHVLKDELAKLNAVITSVVNEQNIFQNNEYNFLSKDVCQKYQVILESDLKKQLKLNVKSIGESLLLIPREEEQALLQKRGLKKDEICTRIANHYMKILYLLCLIKYVYNLERHGDLSIMGIIMRNIQVSKSTIRIDFCKANQKDLRSASGDDALRLDFSNLEGLRFFVDYVLDPTEASVFLRTMRHVLSRKPKGLLRKDFEAMEIQEGGSQLKMEIAPDNPIFEENWCRIGPGTVTIPLAENDGKEALKLYKAMKARFSKHVKSVEAVLFRLVVKSPNGEYTLKDVNKEELDAIAKDLKTKVKIMYLRTLLDFQDLLDRVKSFPKAIIV